VRKLTLSLAVMAALLPVRGYPLGLGELELNSALNQELNAEIEVLSAVPEDAEQLIVKLAGRDAFSRAGLDRPHMLQQLKFKVVHRSGTPFVQVFTKVPVREPYISFLLEVDWPQGHLLREYTLLLDPPVYNNAQAASSSESAVTSPATDSSHPFIDPSDSAQAQSVTSEQQSAVATHSSAQAAPVQDTQTATISDDSGRSVNYQVQAMPAVNTSVDQYRVQQNDTLWSMANRMRPDSSVSVEQMMLALVRKNPEAFIQENINGVKRGYILRIPNRDEATQLDRQEAIAQAREHGALWREYSQGAASAAPASSMEMESTETGGTAADQVRDADGHLSIVGASEDGSEHAGSNQDPDASLSNLKQDLAMAREQLESERLEKEDLKSRLAELEQRVKRVIEMDDSELAQLQEDLSQTQQPAVAVVDEPEIAETMPAIEEDIASEEMPLEEPGIEEDILEEEPMGESSEMSAESSEEALFVDETDSEAPVEEMEAEEPETQYVEPVDVIEPPAFAQQKPKGFVAKLMEDPKLLGMVGGGLAFVLLLLALLLKRIRGNKANKEESWTASMDEPLAEDKPDVVEDIDATVKTEAVDMNSTAEMSAEPDDDLGMDDTQIEAPSGESLEDTVFSLDDAETAEPEEDDRDDVIAEADVYLAYGIYQQAEELLGTAIDQNPERDDYRMKLLETHYAAKNATAFETLAEDVKSRKGDDKAFWDRVTAMGVELCPESALFSGADAVIGDFDANALIPDKPQTTDLELDVGDETATDFDLGLDDVEEVDDDATQILTEPVALEEPADENLDLAGDLEGIANELDDASGDFDDGELLGADDTSSNLEFDLGELEDVGEELTEPEAEPEADAPADDLDIDDDFSLDFDASDLGFEETEEPEAEEEVSLDLDADLDLGNDLDDSLDSDETVSMDLDEEIGDIEIGGDELDLDDTEIDLSDADISDDAAELDSGSADLDANLDLSEDGDFDISELSEDVDEVSTKLDLAKAYLDMGDNEGALSILEEVKSEGNDEQKKQAEELIQQAS